MRRILLLTALLSFGFVAGAQTDWKKVQNLIDNGSYKSAYAQSEKVYKKTNNSSELLTAAWYMMQAAQYYQEDSYDSSEARLRAIMPRLEAPERAVCYAWLGVMDSALMDEELLKQTPSDRVKRFCIGMEGKDLDMTPTVYDVVVMTFFSEKMYRDFDTDSPERSADIEALMEKMLDFHKNDGDDIRIWLDLLFLDLKCHYQKVGQEEMYKSYIDKYRASTSIYKTQLYSGLAQYLYNHGRPEEALLYCDTAIALAPVSSGGKDAYELRDRITQVQISFRSDNNTDALPGRPSLHTLEYRNIGHLYFGIAPYEDVYSSSFRPKVFRSWELDVDTSDKYNSHGILFDIPALEAGHWLLVASTDGVFEKTDAILEIRCTDMKVMWLAPSVFQLINAIDGTPIVNQEVSFFKKQGGEEETLYSAFSDVNGRVRYEGGNGQFWIRIVRDGYEIVDNFWNSVGGGKAKMTPETMLFSDRPVYRPGDTVFVAMVHYETDGIEARTLESQEVTFVLIDPNFEERDRQQDATDEFGVASALFIIPRDGLSGGWYIDLISMNDENYDFGLNDELPIFVEEYKQPKFMVTLDAQKTDAGANPEPPTLGKPYTVHGLAQSYSGAQIDGAKVVYTINRYTRYWREFGSFSYSTTIDSTYTAADGSFAITFTPMPDSTSNLLKKPHFYYEILAEVTDLNGETQSASTTVIVGYHNTVLELAGISGPEVSSLESVAFSLKDINERPLAGDVKVTVSRLHLPDTARLLPPILKEVNTYNTLSRERFRELFPTFFYSSEESQINGLKSDWDWSATEHITADELQHTVKLPRLKSGIYRIVATCGEEADTQYVRLTLPDERRVQAISALIWADIQLPDSESQQPTAQPGDRITLRYGSAFDDVRFFYILTSPDGSERDVRWLPAGRAIKQLSIDVDSAMLGDFTVELFAVKDGVTQSWSKRVYVPFRHKQLQMDITTFRDKLQPGEQEEWTIKVSGHEHSSLITQRSALIMTMYDDALTPYGRSSVRFMDYPWRMGRSSNARWLKKYAYSRNYYSELKLYLAKDPDISFWIVDNGMLTGGGRYRMGRYKNMELMSHKDALLRGESAQLNELEIVAEKVPVIEIGSPESGMRITSEGIAHMPANSADAIVATIGGMGYSDGSDRKSHESVQIRTNLSTLAFFVADLRTDSTGTATYRFRVPDLLTRWRVQGLAVTQDLKIGTLDRYLVTQKSLMVQPNIPRFLRHGDSLVLMAKVMNLTDNERQVRVNFSLKDASQNTQIIQNTQMVTVPAQGSAQVTFSISDLPTDLFVATYEITAQTCDEMTRRDLPRLSDGERGQIPVVTSRQAVTLSQPVYINGKGEKNFTFHLSPLTSTAEPHFLAAELVSNPIWLAVKSMPYLKQQENPSTLYLANSLYVNTLAKNIIGAIGTIGSIETISNTANTRLKINEDIKQTLLEATPWLRDADAEQEQRQAIANYFDKSTLDSEFRKMIFDLSQRQNSDGGWSWMPEDESSLWVTMQVLKRIAPLSEMKEQQTLALNYVDREEQRHYEKYIKPYLKKGYKWEPDNIDYLYARSFYGKGKTEAYKFYYNNALKNYKNYNGLYTQAQLALIFQRHGDQKAARDLIRRIKEKSLESDEMGMYWRDNRSGWYWYERPIETQALLIQAFREVTPQDTVAIALMQQWLLKQKQTTHWGNDRATVEAINALVPPTSDLQPPTSIEALKSTSLTLCGVDLTAPSEGLEGYRIQRWEGPALDSIIALGDSTITIRKTTSGIAWGAVYFQYTDDMDKIPSSESGITLRRTYLDRNNQNIQNTPNTLKVGDRIKVRIEISCDRNMEYLELIDGRPSCVEPLSTRSGWCWSYGLHYYVEVKNTATHCYINRLEKGKYVVEYEVYVTNPGTFLAGPVTMQCMYAPEFRATAPAQRLTVE